MGTVAMLVPTANLDDSGMFSFLSSPQHSIIFTWRQRNASIVVSACELPTPMGKLSLNGYQSFSGARLFRAGDPFRKQDGHIEHVDTWKDKGIS